MPNKYKIRLGIKIQAQCRRYIQPYLSYYRQILKYATMQTSESYNLKREWKSKASGIIFQFIVIAIIFIWRSKAEGMEAMNAFFSILIAIGMVAVALFVYHLLRAPVQLYLTERSRIRTTRLKELNAIEKEQRGVYLLALDLSPFQEEYKTKTEPKITYRVGVQSAGKNSIDDVSVHLLRLDAINILPINLRVMGSSQETIRVDPSNQPRQFFDVFEWYPQESQIRICYHVATYKEFKDAKDTFDIHAKHIGLTLAAQGRNVAETECDFRLVLKGKKWVWYSEEEYKILAEGEQNGNRNQEL